MGWLRAGLRSRGCDDVGFVSGFVTGLTLLRSGWWSWHFQLLLLQKLAISVLALSVLRIVSRDVSGYIV